MSATVKVTLGEVESVYRCTYPLARAIEVILHHSDCAEEIEQEPCEDAISRQAAIDAIEEDKRNGNDSCFASNYDAQCFKQIIKELPPVKPVQCLTDDDKETIRIHLGAIKEELCNQHRWDEAKEYEGIIDRLMHLPPVKPEQKMGRWIEREDAFGDTFYNCSACGEMWSTIDGNPWDNGMDYCPNCGAKMEGEA